jgi:glucose-1-phosphate thymidylyltransferase
VKVKVAVLLAGGSGSRLYPLTKVVNKHLLPVYDKPLIYYSLSVLMLSGVREIAVVTSPGSVAVLQELLGDGSQFGISISFFVQPEPLGLPNALLLCEEFVGDQPFGLMLGDNIFYSAGLSGLLKQMFEDGDPRKATILTVGVKDPERFGVVERSPNGELLSIIEKPTKPNSNRAVTGLYRFPIGAIQRVKDLKPSNRGELEITDLLNTYISSSAAQVIELPRGAVWFDAGTIGSLCQAAEFVKAYQEASGCRIGCPEEIALRNGWIDGNELLNGVSASQRVSPYFQYLRSLGQVDG